MEFKKKSLAKIIVNNSIRIFIISTLVLLSVILYFFQKEIMYSSMVYGDLSLKNSAQSIEKDNAEYTLLIKNLQRTISFQLSTMNEKEFDGDFLENYLTDFLTHEDNLIGAFLIIEATYVDNGNRLDESGNYNIYISKSGKTSLQDYQSQKFYAKPKSTLKSYVTNPYKRHTDDRSNKVYTITYPIILNGEFAGVIGCDVDMEAVYEQLEDVKIYDGNSSVALLDNQGTYLTHSFEPELVGKTLEEDCLDPEIRLKNLQEGKIDQWFEKEDGVVGAITNPIYFNDHQMPWQLQAKVNAKYVFANVIAAAYWIIPTIIFAILFFVFRMRFYIGRKIRPLIDLDGISSKIANGDLTHDINIESDNEIGSLAESFSKMVEKLQYFVKEIQQGSENITSASQQLGSSSQTLSSSTNEQASTGEEISSNMEEMSASVQQNANKSQDIKKASGNMLEKFNVLNEDAQKAAAMQQEIAELSGLINDIAQNIKILSLNAAVEAARAGEHGKGFAVVAREVQKLSESTTSSAMQITDKITESSEMSLQTMEFVKEMVPQLRSLNDDIEEINISSQEQASNVQQVTNATQQFNESTQANAASAEELAGTAEELSNQAEVLMDLANQFKIKK
ncbi:methyl-accepting chemotaxis protein [Marinilabilia sp.]